MTPMASTGRDQTSGNKSPSGSRDKLKSPGNRTASRKTSGARAPLSAASSDSAGNRAGTRVAEDLGEE